MFPSPTDAVRFARSTSDSLTADGLPIRAGVHAGEVERRGDDVGGLAVHIAARICAKANGGEVLVSRTVADLLVGTGEPLHPAGEHHLKGVPGAWTLFLAGSDVAEG